MRNKELVDGLRREGINDEKVLEAMLLVPREEFVSASDKDRAYLDMPLGIGFDQTISQPYVVALMTSALKPQRHHKVLEIGTGSGYQAAILSRLVRKVVTIERIKGLHAIARERFDKLGFDNIMTIYGDGFEGCIDESPFDSIILTSAPNELPTSLLEQLKEGGIIVAPIGTEDQMLIRYEKRKGKIRKENMISVRFVPMIHGRD